MTADRRQQILASYAAHARRFDELARRRPAAAPPLLAPVPAVVDERPVRVAPAKQLTRRGSEVLILIANGLTNREMADYLGVGEETVKTHVQTLLDNLPAKNRAHAVAIGFRRGLLMVEPPAPLAA